MSVKKRKIIIAITGASGSIYAKLLLDTLSTFQNIEVGVLLSDNAKIVWKTELENENYNNYPFTFYNKNCNNDYDTI